MISTDEDRRALREAAADLLRGAAGPPTETWRLLADVGWLGILVPDDLGGSGGCLSDLVVVSVEMGRVLHPGPFLTSAVDATATLLAALAMPDSRPVPAAEQLLAALASGQRTAAVIDGDTPGNQLSLQPDATHGYLLHGTAPVVVGARGSDVLLVSAQVDGVDVLALVERADVRITPLDLADASRDAAAIRFHAATVPPASVLATGAAATRIRRRARLHTALAVAADAVGGARAVLDLSVSYAKTRVQFGRPIGAFQAIKHKLADMYIGVEAAEAAVVMAAGQLDAGDRGDAYDNQATRAALAAAAFGTSSYVDIAGQAIQIHGGIGFTWEHPCHRYLKRAWLDRAMVGDTPALRSAYAALLYDAPGDAPG